MNVGDRVHLGHREDPERKNWYLPVVGTITEIETHSNGDVTAKHIQLDDGQGWWRPTPEHIL